MPQLLEGERTGRRHPRAPREPAPVLEYALLAVGLLLALFGTYAYLAPAAWVLGGLTEGWHLGSFALGGLILSGGFSLFADRMLEADRERKALAVAGSVLSLVAFAAAVASAVVWLL